jgi:ribosomal-protein-alanine N-acetyltransferase
MALRDVESGAVPLPHWRRALPEITGERVILRELRPSDATALYRVASLAEIARHTWPPPGTVEAVEHFIEWTSVKRARGEYICFGIVPRREGEVAGMFELRPFHPGCLRVELGFILHPAWWSTGLFAEAAGLVCDFAFRVLGTHRIEARASAENPRGNAALRKIGARKEGRLRAAFVSQGRYIDQYLWAIVGDPGNHPKGNVAVHAPSCGAGALNA